MDALTVQLELHRGAVPAGAEVCALVTLSLPPGRGGKLECLSLRLLGLERAAPEVHAALPAPPARAFTARQGHWWTRELQGVRLLLCGPCRLEPGARRRFLARLRLPPGLPPSLPSGRLVRRTYVLEAEASLVGSVGSGSRRGGGGGGPAASPPLHVWGGRGASLGVLDDPGEVLADAVEVPPASAAAAGGGSSWGALIAAHFAAPPPPPGGKGDTREATSPLASPRSSGRRLSGDGLMPLFLSPSRYRRPPKEDGEGGGVSSPPASTSAPAASSNNFTVAFSGRPLAEMRLEGLRGGEELSPGTVLGATLDFPRGERAVACSAFEARLEALESSPLLPQVRATEEAHCQVSEDVSRLGRTFFMLQVPLRVPTSCAAEHVELSWRLRFTFYVVPPDGDGAGQEVSLGWELPVQMVTT